MPSVPNVVMQDAGGAYRSWPAGGTVDAANSSFALTVQDATLTYSGGSGTFVYDNDMSSGDPIAFTEGGVSLAANAADPSTIVSTTGSITLTYVWLNPAVYPGSSGTGLRTSRMCELRMLMGAKYSDSWWRVRVAIASNYYHPRNNDPSGYAWGDGGSYNNKLHLMFEDDYETGPFLQSIELHPHDTEMGASKGSVRTFSVPAGIDVNSGYGQLEDMIMLSDRGKDVDFYFHYRYATVANNNGTVEVWKGVDGSITKICEITNAAWYSATGVGFDEGYTLGYANSAFSALSAADNLPFVLKWMQFATSNQWGLT